MYRLRCSADVIQRCHNAGDLELFLGDFSIPVEGWENNACVTVRDAVKCKPHGLCSQQTNAIVILVAVTISDAIA